jgi:acyl-CoA synthetase (NDP forming)
MINEALINPSSIVVIGGSNHLSKPGGKLVKNLIDGNFNGSISVVNPKETTVQGLTSYGDVSDVPQSDLAILVVPPQACLNAVKILAHEKNTKAFIIISAGFGEGGEEGKLIESELKKIVDDIKGCLIGPNCIGILNSSYNGVFTSPLPPLYKSGCDLISSSGATAVFIMEAGITNGLRFSSVFSLGNSAQTGVEEVLEYMDENYVEGESSPIKLLYMESIKNPQKILKHAASLIKKGVRIAAIKAGSTDAGSRAAASHTGAIANSDMAVRALFRKAGIVYCSSRDELITVASIFNYKPLQGKNIAIITHAGGSAVMLSDSLAKRDINIPNIEGKEKEELLSFLHPGSSASNPIDFLATGTAEQLGIIIDYCEHKFDQIDAMVVVFGSSGLFNVKNVYDVLKVKLDVCKKPIFPVLPSIINASKEIEGFLSNGYVNFPDEVLLGTALAAVYHTKEPIEEKDVSCLVDVEKIRSVIESGDEGFLDENSCFELLQAAGIKTAKQARFHQIEDLSEVVESIGYPLVMKVIGPLHKSDVKGVRLNIKSKEEARRIFEELMAIEDAEGVVCQKMYQGLELFIGGKYESGLGHLVIFGFGGIFVEIFNDVKAGLIPLGPVEVHVMLKKLMAYPLMEGARGQEGIDIELFVQQIIRISQLLEYAPEIVELDVNPLMAFKEEIVAVDVRIRIER